MLYLVRHGQTDDNIPPKRAQGFSDTPLNEAGLQQAKELAEKAEELGLKQLFSSPLKRALMTADVIATELGLRAVIDSRLAEGDRGLWEGRFFEEIERTEPETYAAWRAAEPDFRFPGGESLVEHRARALEAVAEVAALNQPTLIVTHRGTIRFVLLELQGLGVEHFHKIEVANAEPIAISEAQAERLARTLSPRVAPQKRGLPSAARDL